MKCEKCSKSIPETLNYCPTCKINELKTMNNKAFDSLVEKQKTPQTDFVTPQEQLIAETKNIEASTELKGTVTSNLLETAPQINEPVNQTVSLNDKLQNVVEPSFKNNNIVLNIFLFLASIFLLYITSNFFFVLLITSIPFLNTALRLYIFILMFNSISNIFSGKEKNINFFKRKFMITAGISLLVIIYYICAPKILATSELDLILSITTIIYYHIIIIISAFIIILTNTRLNYKKNTKAKKITINLFIIMSIIAEVLTLFGLLYFQGSDLDKKMSTNKTACFVCQNLTYSDYIVYKEKIYYTVSKNEIYVSDLDRKNNKLFFKSESSNNTLKPKFVLDEELYISVNWSMTYKVNIHNKNDIKLLDYKISDIVSDNYAYWYNDSGVFKANIKTAEKEQISSSNGIQKIMLHNNDIYYMRWNESLKRQVVYKNDDENMIYQYRYGTSNGAYKIQIIDNNLYILDGHYLVKINLLLNVLESEVNVPSGNSNIKLTFGNSGIITQIVNSDIVLKYDYNLNSIEDTTTRFIRNNNLDVFSDFEYLDNNLLTLYYSKSRPDGSAEETLIIFNEITNKMEKYVDIISYTYDDENIYIIKNDKKSPILKVKYKS